jgi:hypothetical protein
VLHVLLADMKGYVLFATLAACATLNAQTPEFNPLKEMQTVEGHARITVQGTMRTWLSTRPGNGVRFYLDGVPMGFTTRDDPAFTQEVAEGSYLLEACMGLLKVDDRKGGCISYKLNAEPNTLYSIQHEVYLPPQIGLFPTPPEQKFLSIQQVKF